MKSLASPILITDGNLPKSSANMIMMLGGFEKVIGKEEIVARNIMQDLGLMSAVSAHVICSALRIRTCRALCGEP